MFFIFLFPLLFISQCEAFENIPFMGTLALAQTYLVKIDEMTRLLPWKCNQRDWVNRKCSFCANAVRPDEENNKHFKSMLYILYVRCIHIYLCVHRCWPNVFTLISTRTHVDRAIHGVKNLQHSAANCFLTRFHRGHFVSYAFQLKSFRFACGFGKIGLWLLISSNLFKHIDHSECLTLTRKMTHKEMMPPLSSAARLKI